METAGRRSWFALLIIGMVFALAAALVPWRGWFGSPTPPPALEPLTLGVADSFLTIPVIIAESRGFLRDAGLDVTVRRLPSGKAALEALLQGEVDVATVAETPLAIASLQGHRYAVIGNYLSSDTNCRSLAHPDSGIKSPADLRGRRVGVIAGTGAEYCLHVLLTDHGLSSANIVQVPMKGSDMSDALTSRRVDAIAAFEPYLSKAQQALGNRGQALLDRDRCPNTGSYVTRPGFSGQRREALVRLLRGTGQAIDWMRSHRHEAIVAVVNRLDTDAAFLEAQWSDYRFALELQQSYLGSLEDQARWAMRSGLVKAAQTPNYLEFLDISPLKTIKPEAVTVIH